MYPGEVQFVPCPGSAFEDDGILLAAVTDVRKGEPDLLLVLDAKTFTEVARAEVTVHIPNVIHGLFIPSSQQLQHWAQFVMMESVEYQGKMEPCL